MSASFGIDQFSLASSSATRNLVGHPHAFLQASDTNAARGKCLAYRTVKALTRSAQGAQRWPMTKPDLQISSAAPHPGLVQHLKYALVLIVEVQPLISTEPLEPTEFVPDVGKLRHREPLRA